MWGGRIRTLRKAGEKREALRAVSELYYLDRMLAIHGLASIPAYQLLVRSSLLLAFPMLYISHMVSVGGEGEGRRTPCSPQPQQPRKPG